VVWWFLSRSSPALLAALFFACAACSNDRARSTEEEATLRAIQFANGSGVYLGDGLALTNHHVVSNSWRAAMTLGRPLRLEENFQSLTDHPGQHSTLRSRHYCFSNDGVAMQVALVAAPRNPLCFPVDNSGSLQARVDNQPASPVELLFTMERIDLAVLRLLQPPLADLPFLHPGLAEVGTRVIIAGYPRGDWALTSCEVTAETAPVRDPDPRLPDPVRWTLPSVTVTCPPGVVTYGASGSAVYNADSGDLIGLVWSGSNDDVLVYVTPIETWLEPFRAAPSLAETSLATW
jgi:hypothetical protein